jgi:hypothetical protein
MVWCCSLAVRLRPLLDRLGWPRGFGGVVEVRERITIFFEGSFQGLGPVVASYLRHLAASMAPFQPGPAWFQHELLRINI